MPLFVLGAIVIIAAFLLIHSFASQSGGKKKAYARWSDVAPQRPKREYKKSADGKVVYLFDDDKKKGPDPKKDDAHE
ncbi:MAG: hypothetical protein LBN35_00720 [Clostridiales Family XIII bacterium]|jgi:hypothetical protein|nr:hypothetical protein [Clostridiales Family XIII bacterium]